MIFPLRLGRVLNLRFVSKIDEYYHLCYVLCSFSSSLQSNVRLCLGKLAFVLFYNLSGNTRIDHTNILR